MTEQSTSQSAQEPQATEQEQSGPTQDEQSYVPLTEATDEEIQAFLNGQMEAEQEDESDEPREQEEEAETDSTTEGSEETAETQEAAEETQDDGQQEDSERISEGYVKELEKRLAQQEAFIKRRSTEIGELRKKLQTANDQLKEQLKDEEFMADPSAAVDARLQMRENEQKIQELDAQEQQMAQVMNNQKIVQNYVNPKEWDLQGMVQCLEEDGLPAESIRAFATNPYAAADGVTLVQLHKRQRAEGAFRQLAAYTQKLLEENKALKEKPHEMLKKVEKNIKQPASVTNTNGGSGSSRGLSIDPSQIANLSDEELNSLLEGASAE